MSMMCGRKTLWIKFVLRVKGLVCSLYGHRFRAPVYRDRPWSVVCERCGYDTWGDRVSKKLKHTLY